MFYRSGNPPKNQAYASGKKKLVTKAIIRSVDVEAALHNGLIEIKNSSFAWNFYHGPEGQKIDIMARRTLEKLLKNIKGPVQFQNLQDGMHK